MKKLNIEELKNYYEKEVTISGFVDNIRNLQWVQFVILRDATGKVQVTIEKSEEQNKEMVSIIDSLPLESTVKMDRIKAIYETAKAMYAKKEASEWLKLDRRYVEKLIREVVGYTKASQMLMNAKKGK